MPAGIPRPRVAKTCLNPACGRAFTVRAAIADRPDGGRYCSHACVAAARRGWRPGLRRCLECDAPFEVAAWHDAPKRFCGRVCSCRATARLRVERRATLAAAA